MSTVIDWLSRLTAYGYLDLGSDFVLIVILVAVLFDLERVIALLRDIASALCIEDDVDDQDDDDDGQPPAVDGPATVPAGTVIDDEHEAFIERELGGRTFHFRPSERP